MNRARHIVDSRYISRKLLIIYGMHGRLKRCMILHANRLRIESPLPDDRRPFKFSLMYVKVFK